MLSFICIRDKTYNCFCIWICDGRRYVMRRYVMFERVPQREPAVKLNLCYRHVIEMPKSVLLLSLYACVSPCAFSGLTPNVIWPPLNHVRSKHSNLLLWLIEIIKRQEWNSTTKMRENIWTMSALNIELVATPRKNQKVSEEFAIITWTFNSSSQESDDFITGK